jgi:hypothetical protein
MMSPFFQVSYLCSAKQVGHKNEYDKIDREHKDMTAKVEFQPSIYYKIIYMKPEIRVQACLGNKSPK